MKAASSLGMFLRAAARWRPGQAIAAVYRLRGWITPRPETALLNSEQLSFVRFQDASSSTTGAAQTASARSQFMVLELPMDGVLTQTVSLPEQVRRHLQRVIEHNLPQWSPFSVGEVLVAHRASPQSGMTFNLDLRYALRSNVQSMVDELHARGIQPVAVALGDRAWLSIIDAATVSIHTRRQQRVRLLSLTAVILSICLWYAAIWRQEKQLQQVQQSRYQTIAQLRQIGDEVAQLRKIQGAHRFLTDAADKKVGEVVQLLAATLPASVAPLAMTVERGTLRLVVPADSAETVRAALASKAGFENLAVERVEQNQATITAAIIGAKAR